MRKLSILMSGLIFGSAVYAQTFVMPNKGGGEITLTFRPCVINGQTIDGLREGYTWSQSSAYQRSCWTIVDGNVHVLYLETKDRMVYPLNEFREKR